MSAEIQRRPDRHRRGPHHRQRDPVGPDAGHELELSSPRASTSGVIVLQRGAGHPRHPRRRSSPPSTSCAPSSTTSSPPAASARPMTTSPRNASRKRFRRAADRPSRGAPAVPHLLQAGRAQRGADAHGDDARGRDPDRQSGLARAGLPHRQCLRHGRHPARDAGDVRRRERRPQGRPADAVAHGRMRRSPKACWPRGWARSRSATPISISAPTRSRGAAPSAWRWCCAAATRRGSTRAAAEIADLIRALGGTPTEL